MLYLKTHKNKFYIVCRVRGTDIAYLRYMHRNVVKVEKPVTGGDKYSPVFFNSEKVAYEFVKEHDKEIKKVCVTALDEDEARLL